VIIALLITTSAWTQTAVHLSGTVQDPTGRPVAGAAVVINGARGDVSTTSDVTGHFTLDYPAPGDLTFRASSSQMRSAPVRIQTATSPVILTLQPAPVAQQVTVTTTRSSVDLPATANTVYALGPQQLRDYPAINLDDKLRQQAGFELFRRSSSRVQNPTSQGISLRGLGSTAASRTLVLQQNVPLNDPFGGWIHWNEIPQDAVAGVALATGGGSDLYGSSALGGVINLALAPPTPALFELSVLGGSQDTSSISGRADLGGANRRWGERRPPGPWWRGGAGEQEQRVGGSQ